MNPFMLAIKNGSTHLNVAKAMAKMDPSLVTLKLDSGLTVSNWAQEKGHDGFLKVCFVTVLYLASLLPFYVCLTFTKSEYCFFGFEESHYLVFCMLRHHTLDVLQFLFPLQRCKLWLIT